VSLPELQRRILPSPKDEDNQVFKMMIRVVNKVAKVVNIVRYLQEISENLSGNLKIENSIL
jgi:hypothetical protein